MLNTRLKYLFVSTAILLCSLAGAEDFRTFTNQDGKSISAKVVSFASDDDVVVELENGGTFNIPIGSLSLDDQAFLATRKKTLDATAHPRGWRQITVHLPGVEDEIVAPGIFGAFYRIGAKSWAGEIPAGMWLRIVSEQPGNWPSTPELLYQFEGKGSDLRFSFEGGIFRLSVNGAPPKAVGAVALIPKIDGPPSPLTGEAKLKVQREIFEKAIGERGASGSFCIQPSAYFERSDYGKYRKQFDSVVLSEIPLDGFFSYRSAKELGIRAIRLHPYDEPSPLVNDPSPSLEYLSFERPAEDTVGPQPNLKVLELDYASPSQLQSLEELPNLEFLTVRRGSSSGTFDMSGWTELKNFQGVDFPKDSWRLEPAIVARIEFLESVYYQNWEMRPDGFWMNRLNNVRNIFFSSSLDSEPITRFAKNGGRGLRLRLVENENPVSYSDMPNLRALLLKKFVGERTLNLRLKDGSMVKHTAELPYPWKLDGFDSLGYLEFLRIGGTPQLALDALGTLPNAESLKTLLLDGLINCHDLSVIERFTNLRVLGIYDMETVAGETRTPGPLDLTSLTKLEALEHNPALDIKVGELEHFNGDGLSPFLFQYDRAPLSTELSQ